MYRIFRRNDTAGKGVEESTMKEKLSESFLLRSKYKYKYSRK